MFDLTAASGTKTMSRYAVQTTLEEGDVVKHKLFGTGTVIEVWRDTAVVRFQNEKFGVRKIEARFLEKK